MKPNFAVLVTSFALLFLPLSGASSENSHENESVEEEAEEENEEECEEEESEEIKTIAEVVEDFEKQDGLFPIYRDPKDGALYLEIDDRHLDKEFIYFTHTADGVSTIGHFRGSFRDNLVFSVRKHFDRIEFVEENTHFYFDDENPLSRAAAANVTPALLAVQRVIGEDEGEDRFLIEANDLFLTESFHQVKPSPSPDEDKHERGFSLGKLSNSKSKILEVRNFPGNTDVVVEYVYENEAPVAGGGEDVTDARNVSIRMQHTLIAMPENDYEPRFDDPRIGYFTERVTDMTSPSATPYRDLIRRWHLVKKDPDAALSEPVEPIVWWIENTTPHEYRETIRKAALTWNGPFESAGFKNAVVVKVQPDDAEWEAGDIRYNVLRWTSSPNPPFGGYGPSFSNPRTGQLLGADIMLEYVFVTRQLKMERLFGLAGLGLASSQDGSQGDRVEDQIHCSLGHQLHMENLFGIHALESMGGSQDEVSELVEASLYYLIVHEIGHTLGLNHNMRASQLHPLEEIHNREITGELGLTSSVMDYPAVNLAMPGEEQGLYFTMKPGPYDHWAIEFGYSGGSGDEVAEEQRREEILARSTEPALAFGNDADDMRSPGKAIDPRVMVGDMSGDAIGYSVARFELVRELLDGLKAKFSISGQSYHELRAVYLILTSQYSRSANVVSRYIGGVYVDRSMAGQEGAAKPFTPVSLDDQKRAMNSLRRYVFAPDAFEVPEELYSHLQMQRRGFDFYSEPEDPKLHERVLNIQKQILDHLLHPRVLQRISDSQLYGNEYDLPKFLTDLTEAVFEEDARGNVNTFRQNLQLEYVQRLAKIIDGGNHDFLSKSLALYSLETIEAQLANRPMANTATMAHTSHVRHLIRKALDREET